MKEYLTKNSNGDYQLVNHRFSDDDIEVPDGSDELLEFLDGIEFYKDNRTYFFDTDDTVSWRKSKFEIKTTSVLWQREPKYKEFLNKNDNYNLVMLPEHAGDDERSGLIEVPDNMNYAYYTTQGIRFTSQDTSYFYGRCLWQRYTQPESLPFVDDEVVEIEFTTDIKKYEEFQRDIEKSYNHYFKDVSNLKFIDVYRVLDLFAVEHPCLQHSVKKLLCAGQRGSKNRDKDIQEAIDSLLRYQEMRSEDNQ